MIAMSEDARDAIIALNRERRDRRASLTGDLRQAKIDLHPRTLFARWTGQKKLQITSAADIGKRKLAKNAPVIGLASAAILLFSSRKPILNLFHKLRTKAQQAKDPKS
jgi:hypothetical protein